MKKKRKDINELEGIQISSLWKKILLTVGLIFFALFFVHKIFFINADLGRHIKNGEIVFSDFTAFRILLTTNYYSYTEPGFPLVNHHWGSGVIFYIIWKLFGFTGLSLFQVFLNVATAFIFFKIAEKKSDFIYAFFFFIISIPLITGRTEIRPEAFSYFLTGIFYYFLTLYSEEKISFRKILFILFPLQLLWANLHIFFVLGIFLTGVFWIDSLLNKKYLAKKFSTLMVAEVIICMANPNGIKGFLEPFMILREYGYMIAENQSLFFMQKRFPENMMYYHFEILFSFIMLLFLFVLYKKRNFKFSSQLIILLFFSILSFKMIRGIPLWGLFFIPFASINIINLSKSLHFNTEKLFQRGLIIIPVIIIFYGLFTRNNYYSPFKGYSGLGLFENINRSSDFIKKNNVSGPIFNNYDIGGYLIFNLFPEHKVFVDNRPEAYSIDFFKRVYEPMQEKEEKWKEFSAYYNFNCIYFYRHDNTPHAQPFLIRRINDAEWAPVFVDDFTIIFLKRNEKNVELIKKHELPKSIFSAVPQ